MQHGHASRHVLPILGSCLAALLLAGCSDGWPDDATVEGRMLADCASRAEPVVCHGAWLDGYTDIQDGLTPAQTAEKYAPMVNDEAAGYRAGLDYALAVHP